MDIDLDDKTIIITGGTRGLGLAAAKRLVAEGANVLVCGRDAEHVRAIQAELTAGPGRVIGIAADVTVEGDLRRLVDTALERFGRIDGLVNNAGAGAATAFTNLTGKAIVDDLQLKVLPMVRLTQLAAPYLRENGGAIVNSLAIAARAPGRGSLPSAATRNAGLTYTKVLADELGADGIRVNAILIGYLYSAQLERTAAAQGTPVEIYQARLAAEAGIPLGRIGEPDDFADLATFLLSPRSAYVTGTGISLDGGLSPVI